MYETFLSFFDSINSFLWGAPTVSLLVGTGIYLTIRLNFFQISNAPLWIKNTLLKITQKSKATETNSDQGLSPLQAISTALASTIGTGNIAGVAAAISVGGPGAVFWMWISAIFGMMTSYSENVSGIYFRKKNSENQWCGGPMIYIKAGLKSHKRLSFLSKPLSDIYSVFLIGASFGIGNMVQTNSISSSLYASLNISYIVTGLIVSSVTYIIISGGLNRIGNFTEKLVPFMALFYIGSTLLIFMKNIENCNYVFTCIFESAINLKSVSGAFCGIALKNSILTGFKRGVFSNEAGLGASVTVNSCSELKEPCEQGMWGIFAVFTDTIIICTLTAFALISTSVEAYNLDYALKNPSNSVQYVYITTESNKIKEKVHLTDKSENYIPKIIFEENSFKIKLTKKKTYTNIMELKSIINENSDIVSIELKEIEGIDLVNVVFKECFGKYSSIILSASIVLFAFSTIIGWYFYGVKALEFLKGNKKTKMYNIAYASASFLGAVFKLTPIWTISDIFNALMALPNLIALLTLSGTVKKITENYLKRIKGENISPMLSAYSNET